MKELFKIKKCNCDGIMKQTIVSRTIPLAGRNVNIENIKASVCERCGEIYLDGPSILKIESKLLQQSALAKT